MQLVAYGAQDVYLTGNPQITFFKVVYRRHTNFSMEAIQQTITGQNTIKNDGMSTVTIARNGDLITKIYACFKTDECDFINGSKLFKTIEIEIGGQVIDEHTEEWNQVWNELTTKSEKADTLKAMVGDIGSSDPLKIQCVKKVQYPFNFWFCRNTGLALPLIALQYHEVKINLKQQSDSSIVYTPISGSNVDKTFEIWIDYIYLDTDERRRFAQVSHEYLIEQLQTETKVAIGNKTEKHELKFNHPIKELIWTYPESTSMEDITFKLNGHDRFSTHDKEDYFTIRQPFDYHTSIPRQNLPESVYLKDETYILSGSHRLQRPSYTENTLSFPNNSLHYYNNPFNGDASKTAPFKSPDARIHSILTPQGYEKSHLFYGLIDTTDAPAGHIQNFTDATVNPTDTKTSLKAYNKDVKTLNGDFSTNSIVLVLPNYHRDKHNYFNVAEIAGFVSGSRHPGSIETGNGAGNADDFTAADGEVTALNLINSHFRISGYGDAFGDGKGTSINKTHIFVEIGDIFVPTKEAGYVGNGGTEGAQAVTIHALDVAIGLKTDLVNPDFSSSSSLNSDNFKITDIQYLRSVPGEAVARTSTLKRKIAVYSFSLKPEDHQPSGTCNFSRIDKADLSFNITGSSPTIRFYAVNYNVLRIMSGMGGLAYSN